MTPDDRAALIAAGYDPDDPAVQQRMTLARRGLALLGERWRRAGACPSAACLDQESSSANT